MTPTTPSDPAAPDAVHAGCRHPPQPSGAALTASVAPAGTGAEDILDFLRVLSDGAQPRSYTTRLVYPGRSAARKAGFAHFNGRSWVLTPAGRLALASSASALPGLAGDAPTVEGERK